MPVAWLHSGLVRRHLLDDRPDPGMRGEGVRADTQPLSSAKRPHESSAVELDAGPLEKLAEDPEGEFPHGLCDVLGLHAGCFDPNFALFQDQRLVVQTQPSTEPALVMV